MSEEIFDLVVIGAGPGGYVAAIRAAQLGMTVAVVEKRGTLGGVCLNEGCIPSKALLDSSELFHLAGHRFSAHGIEVAPPTLNLGQMMARKDDVVKKLTDGIAFLFKKNKIKSVNGTARLAGSDAAGVHKIEVQGGEEIRAKKVLLATGSDPVQLPSLPFDWESVVSAREALSFDKVPEHLLVVGGGYIGLELGSVWLRLGAQVTVVEMLPRLIAGSDGQVAEALLRSLKKQGMRFLLGAKVAGVEKREGSLLARVEVEGGVQEIGCDKVLVAVGRRPLTAGLGLEELGVALENGRVKVDEDYLTSVPGVYAIGDLISGPMLAHKAMEEGAVCVERMRGEPSLVDYGCVPGVCYTWPEAASVGKTEDALKEEGIPYKSGKFNFMGNGRAKCMDETEGFVKVLSDVEGTRLLGVHIFGPRASDMIAEAVTVMSFGGSSEDIALIMHAHPTLSEAMKEAALDVDKRAIHG
ncbi:Dihydrolipoamide dehydrogenase of 2-oxoglutarate dehydrogenase [Citrifermentans bremense]|uniref:Dihydrolipoyl dehydrogenase n=1 Tax=Citrifermentans bremense TaxID=60035 RepID=A0A6S6LVL6_9BACT|nr:dihydrolipoyl dehydrogenase [Citrifermentans bremense]BCG45962.1 Dihydrolipoamide dehydrogenase of 2-oxoglutarate dehydrogenase [Citrifermentans bremense]